MINNNFQYNNMVMNYTLATIEKTNKTKIKNCRENFLIRGIA